PFDIVNRSASAAVSSHSHTALAGEYGEARGLVDASRDVAEGADSAASAAGHTATSVTAGHKEIASEVVARIERAAVDDRATGAADAADRDAAVTRHKL